MAEIAKTRNFAKYNACKFLFLREKYGGIFVKYGEIFGKPPVYPGYDNPE